MTEIIFRNFYRKYFYHFHLIFTYDGIFGPKMTQFWSFSPKMTSKLTPLISFLTQYMSINLTEIIFRNFYSKMFFTISQKFPLSHIFWRRSPFWSLDPAPSAWIRLTFVGLWVCTLLEKSGVELPGGLVLYPPW